MGEDVTSHTTITQNEVDVSASNSPENSLSTTLIGPSLSQPTTARSSTVQDEGATSRAAADGTSAQTTARDVPSSTQDKGKSVQLQLLCASLYIL